MLVGQARKALRAQTKMKGDKNFTHKHTETFGEFGGKKRVLTGLTQIQIVKRNDDAKGI